MINCVPDPLVYSSPPCVTIKLQYLIKWNIFLCFSQNSIDSKKTLKSKTCTLPLTLVIIKLVQWWCFHTWRPRIHFVHFHTVFAFYVYLCKVSFMSWFWFGWSLLVGYNVKKKRFSIFMNRSHLCLKDRLIPNVKKALFRLQTIQCFSLLFSNGK